MASVVLSSVALLLISKYIKHRLNIRFTSSESVSKPAENNVKVSETREVLFLESLGAIELGSKECKKLFCLGSGNKEEIVFINHGSYGSCPKYVMDKLMMQQMFIESYPDRWFRQLSYPKIRETMEILAPFVGANADDMVFVTNATTATNCIFESAGIQSGDVCLCLDAIYPAVYNALMSVCNKQGASVTVIPYDIPITSHEALLISVRNTILNLVANGKIIKLAVFDHLSWNTAVVLPIVELISICRSFGILIAIDGAHCVGQVEINFEVMKPDYYTSNFHKWMYAPRGSAFIWCHPDRRNTMMPQVVSHNWTDTYPKRFWMQGTRDESCFVATSYALKFYKAIGTQRIIDYNRGLLQWAVDYISERFQTERICPAEMNSFLGIVRLPIVDANDIGNNVVSNVGFFSIKGAMSDSVLSRSLMIDMMDNHHMIAALFSFNGFIHVRLSAQIYNSKDDYIRFGDYVQSKIENPSQNSR